ncbi:LLM class flavin-dependent oxidoreductase [Oceanobacillus sp. CAU 1775]
MKLSILDQVPISSGKTATEALEATIELAVLADKLGYKRYWVAEHHGFDGLASPAPDILLSIIGSKTKKIRIGSGATLLPNYKPYNIAERYNMLATLYPGRVDLGLGRAPGGSAEASIALVDNFLEEVRNYPQRIDELLHFLNRNFPSDHIFSKVKAMPVPRERPVPWLLGTSVKSAVLALEKELPYVYGDFMSEADGPSIVKGYFDNYQGEHPEAIVTVSVICAETKEEAEELALSNQVWQLQRDKGIGDGRIPSIQETKEYEFTTDDLELFRKSKNRQIIGTPTEVRQALESLQEQYNVDEFMIVTITHDYEVRKKSYELLAKEFKLK